MKHFACTLALIISINSTCASEYDSKTTHALPKSYTTEMYVREIDSVLTELPQPINRPHA